MNTTVATAPNLHYRSGVSFDVVVAADLDWGIGKVVQLGPYRFDAGVSGFATAQVTTQTGGISTGRYSYYGAGPEISAVIADGLLMRLRTQWEFATRNAVQGNNIWIMVSTRF